MYFSGKEECMFEDVYSFKELIIVYRDIIFSLSAEIHIKVYCVVDVRLPLFALIKIYDNCKKTYAHYVNKLF